MTSVLSLGQKFSTDELDTAIMKYQTQNYCVLVTKDSTEKVVHKR